MITRRLTAISLLLLLLAACQPPPAPPTVAGATITRTISVADLIPETAGGSPTATTSATAPATATTAATATTLTPTAAATATATPPPPASPTPPPATGTPPPPPSLTPTSILPGVPTILDFSADLTEADPGDTVTLSWQVADAATVTLWHLMPTGQLGSFWDVAAEDSFVYEIGAGERNNTTFMLFATNNAGNAQATLAIRLRCTGEWFFANPPPICPFDPPLAGASAEQTFEHGVMIWLETEGRIYVLFDDNTSPHWAAYSDEWDPSQPVDDPALEPPAGFYQPIRGFGLVWREEPMVFSRLGWATALEQGGSSLIQRTSYAKYNEIYILALDGMVWYLQAERSGWEKIAR